MICKRTFTPGQCMISYNSVIQHADKKNFKEGTPNIFRFRNVYIFLSGNFDIQFTI
jgi:hypothetical protein